MSTLMSETLWLNVFPKLVALVVGALTGDKYAAGWPRSAPGPLSDEAVFLADASLILT
jgi:hypothetical protein